MRRIASLITVAGAVLGLAPASASAGWSAPRAVPGSIEPFRVALATDGRGDTAVAWARTALVGRPVRYVESSVHVALWRGSGGRAITRTVWSRRQAAVGGVAVALDRRGELTIAWIDQASDRGLLHGHKTVRAAYRTTSGRWSAVQAVGLSSPFMYAHVWLSAAPDRRVLLTWNARVRAAPGVAAAWRAPGHGFGALLAAGRPPAAAIGDPQTLFDASGAAYLYGTVGCDRATSRGVLLRTSPGGRRFGAPLVVAPAPAKSLSLSVVDGGAGVAAWLRQSCSTTEDLSGPMAARTVRGGVLGPVQPLGEPGVAATAPLAVADASGAASAGWLAFPQGAPNGTPMQALAGSDGAFGAPFAPADGFVPAAVDGGGDRLLVRPTILADQAGAAVLPAGASVAQRASIASAPWVTTAVAAPAGRGAAAVWFAGARLRVATRRP